MNKTSLCQSPISVHKFIKIFKNKIIIFVNPNTMCFVDDISCLRIAFRLCFNLYRCSDGLKVSVSIRLQMRVIL